MNDTLNRLWLLKAIGVNYPLLRDHGQRASKAFLVSVEEGESEAVFEELKVFSGVRIDAYTSQKKMRNILYETNSEFICYLYAASERNRNFLNEILTIARTGSYDGQPLNAPICVICEGLPPGIHADDAYYIRLEGKIEYPNVLIPMDMVVPSKENLSVAWERLQQENSKTDEQKTIFHAAACFIYPCLLKEKQLKDKKMEVFESLLSTAQQMAEEMDDFDGTSDLCDYFRTEFRKWQRKEHFADVYELPNIGQYASEHIDSVMLFSEDNIFLSEKLFREIINPLRNAVTWSVLMNALSEGEILLPEYRDELSMVVPTKVGFYDKNGRLQRKRMMRLNREKLHEAGEREFVKSCLDERRKTCTY